jgi:hypothetical protein
MDGVTTQKEVNIRVNKILSPKSSTSWRRIAFYGAVDGKPSQKWETGVS